MPNSKLRCIVLSTWPDGNTLTITNSQEAIYSSEPRNRQVCPHRALTKSLVFSRLLTYVIGLAIYRVNSTQSIRIRSLENETTRLLSENIELREQVIKLQASLDRRERSKIVVENVEATKRQLEGKVAEMQELLKSLGQAISFSPQGT